MPEVRARQRSGLAGRGLVNKRGYSRQFTPTKDSHGRYLLDKIPSDLWRAVRAKARRDSVSIRALILLLLTDWLAADE